MILELIRSRVKDEVEVASGKTLFETELTEYIFLAELEFLRTLSVLLGNDSGRLAVILPELTETESETEGTGANLGVYSIPSTSVPITYLSVRTAGALLNVNNFINSTGNAYDTFADQATNGFSAIKTGVAAADFAQSADELSITGGKRYQVNFDFTKFSGAFPTYDILVGEEGASRTLEGAQTAVAGYNTFRFTASLTSTALLSFTSAKADKANYAVRNADIIDYDGSVDLRPTNTANKHNLLSGYSIRRATPNDAYYWIENLQLLTAPRGLGTLDIFFIEQITKQTTAGSAITIPDRYVNAVIKYTEYQAWLKVGMQDKASSALGIFNSIMKTVAGTGEDPE